MRMREPGEDDVQEEDGEELVPIWRVLKAWQFGLDRPGPARTAAGSLLFVDDDKRPTTEQRMNASIRIHDAASARLTTFREDFKALRSMDMATDLDVEHGKLLALEVESHREVLEHWIAQYINEKSAKAARQRGR